MILAGTKFEFGTDIDGTLVLIDEVLTPDLGLVVGMDKHQHVSDRYPCAGFYQPGESYRVVHRIVRAGATCAEVQRRQRHCERVHGLHVAGAGGPHFAAQAGGAHDFVGRIHHAGVAALRAHSSILNKTVAAIG